MEISLLDWKEMEVMWERVGQRKWKRWKNGRLVSVEGPEVDLERRRLRAVVVLLDGWTGGEGKGRTEGYGEGVSGIEDWGSFFIDGSAGLEDGY
jgi:hypothetical protein